MKNYFQRIKELRISKGITQKQVADFLNMTSNAYQKYEYGERVPGIETFLSLADYFNVSLDYLVGRSDDPERR